jgi:tetratricopeptide (TPR) repeat protein
MAIKPSRRVANDRLKDAREAAAWSRKALADRVNEKLQQVGLRGTCVDGSVWRWESGAVVNPQDHIIEALCAVFECTAAELGLREPEARPDAQPRSGSARLLSIMPRPAGGARDDGPCVDRSAVRRAIDMALDSEVRKRIASQPHARTPRDSREISMIEQRVSGLRRFDDITGTEGIYDSALTDVNLLAHVMQTCESPECYARCADLAVQALAFAAFTAYDHDDIEAAKDLMEDALRLSAEIDDYALRAHVLAYCALYAAIDSETTRAQDLAARAMLLTTRPGDFGCRAAAWVFVMLARVYALCGLHDDAEPMIMRAESRYSDCESATNPDWIHYFDLARLKAYIAVCYADMGRAREAMRYLTDALALFDPHYHRALAHYRTLMANLLLESGDAEAAARVANEALTHAERVSSQRVSAALRRLGDAMDNYDDLSTVREFTTRLRRVG